jgi:hypothetical protein
VSAIGPGPTTGDDVLAYQGEETKEQLLGRLLERTAGPVVTAIRGACDHCAWTGPDRTLPTEASADSAAHVLVEHQHAGQHWQAYTRQLTGRPHVVRGYIGRGKPEIPCGHDHKRRFGKWAEYYARRCAERQARRLNRWEPI